MRGTAVFLVICLLVTSGGKWEKEAESGCCVLVAEQTGEGKDGCLTVAVGVSGAPGGICALMTVTTLPPGWEVRSVVKAEGAGDLTMTVRVINDPDGCRVILLFDGAEPAPCGGTLAYVTVCPPADVRTHSVPPQSVPPQSVPPQSGREPILRTEAAVLDGRRVPIYYMKETGETDTVPAASCTLTLTVPESTWQGREAVTESGTGQDTEPDTESEASSAAAAEPVPAEKTYGWCVVGCRERYPDGETVDVQLLFRAADGAGKGTPAAFPVQAGQGPGVVKVTVGEAPESGDGVCAVTFSGLPRTGKIRIAGMTENGGDIAFFLLCYEDGEFDGWIPVFYRFYCDN